MTHSRVNSFGSVQPMGIDYCHPLFTAVGKLSHRIDGLHTIGTLRKSHVSTDPSLLNIYCQ